MKITKNKDKKRKITKQFESFWNKLNDPIEIAKQRIFKNRQEKIKSKRDDLSL